MAGDLEGRERYLAKAREAGEQIKDAEERQLLESETSGDGLGRLLGKVGVFSPVVDSVHSEPWVCSPP